MMFLNEFDLARCDRNLDADIVPNRRAVLDVVIRLRDWTNCNSDGWSYWPDPVRASRPAFRLIYGATNAEEDALMLTDCTDAVAKRGLATIKGFCTRAVNAGIMTPQHRDYILTGDDRSMGA